MLTLDELRADVANEAVDTVVVAFTDMQGRLMGKRMHAEYFLEDSVDHGIEGCNYLLALEMEMDPIPGYEIASWERGYGDFAIRPDLNTLRRIPWLDSTALVLGDVLWHDGEPCGRRRAVLKAQVERAAELGYTPMFGSELEFYLLKETYAEANGKHYRGLTPSVPYILDYHVLATTYDEPFIRQLRNGMHGAGIKVESSKGEAWPGQQEINFRFTDALEMADNHVVYKNGAKEIAHLNGCSITFMAKPDHTWIGNSCHIHGSLFRDGEARSRTTRSSARGSRAGSGARKARGLPRAERELVQALRRRLVGADHARVGRGQPHVRLPRRRAWETRRVETRIPGGDVNPYLAFAALIAAGLDGVEQAGAAGEARGQCVRVGRGALPAHAPRGDRGSRGEQFARGALGDDVVDHYLNYARTEQRLFDEVVTCYERERLFERG